MLETVLRRRGYTTLHAPDGSVAVALAEERRFDLILMVRARWGLELDTLSQAGVMRYMISMREVSGLTPGEYEVSFSCLT